MQVAARPARVYISGPMSGLPEFNYPAFFAAEEELVAAGYAVENPARNPEPDPKTWEGFMRMAVKQVADCDALVMLPGWESSRGAKVEVDLAKTLGMHVCEIKEFIPCK